MTRLTAQQLRLSPAPPFYCLQANTQILIKKSEKINKFSLFTSVTLFITKLILFYISSLYIGLSKKNYPERLMLKYFNFPSAEHGRFCNATILDQTIQAK